MLFTKNRKKANYPDKTGFNINKVLIFFEFLRYETFKNFISKNQIIILHLRLENPTCFITKRKTNLNLQKY